MVLVGSMVKCVSWRSSRVGGRHDGGVPVRAVAGGASPGETFDFGPVSPAGLDPSAYPMTGRMKMDLFPWPEVEGDRNVHGPMSALIPSAVAGYALLHQRHGLTASPF